VGLIWPVVEADTWVAFWPAAHPAGTLLALLLLAALVVIAVASAAASGLRSLHCTRQGSSKHFNHGCVGAPCACRGVAVHVRSTWWQCWLLLLLLLLPAVTVSVAIAMYDAWHQSVILGQAALQLSKQLQLVAYRQ
jgi:hypothetical protein